MSETIETGTPPADETANAPATETTTAAETPADTPADTAAADTEEPAPKRSAWWQDRIAELTREKHEARREADLERARSEQYAAYVRSLQQPAQGAEQTTGQTTQQQPSAPTQDFETVVNSRVAQALAMTEFNNSCNAIYDKGKAAHPDFDEAAKSYASLGGLQDKPEFLRAVTKLPNGADVFYHLGKNPEKAMEVLRLPVVDQAIELARLSTSLGAPAKPAAVSRAPAPVKPIAADPPKVERIDDPNLSIADFIRIRNEQAKAKGR